MKKLAMYLASTIASLALFVGIVSANTPSALIFYQPSIPKGLEKYKK